MFDIHEKPGMVERALLVGVCFKGEDPAEADSLLQELGELVNTLGIPIVDRCLVPCAKPQPRLLIGSGKADEIVARAEELRADVIVIDNDLSPAQQRNWEALSKRCVIDREEVILDIFAGRALTREARLQVDLARLEYSLPRLTRAWTHLNRQSGSGGTGLRGEGEKQLEVDRRMVRRRLDRLKEDLAAVRRQRATQRKERMRIPLPHAAIVGYTNAGKSSLLRRLTDANVLVENKLFATLDTTTRKVELPDGQSLLLTDTVGFVRKLPHGLVEAFKATLEEAVLADFRIHMVDAAHPQAEVFYRTTMDVLGELGADPDRTLTVFNKMDAVTDPAQVAVLKNHFPQAVFLSVRTGEGLDTLLARLADTLSDLVDTLEYRIPIERADVVSALHDLGRVLHTRYQPGEVELTAIIPKRARPRFHEFEQNGTSAPRPECPV
jgi:GTP-binding protein HflX